VHGTIDVVHVLLFLLSFLLTRYFLSSGSSRGGRFGTGRGGNFQGEGMRGRGNYNGGRSYGRGDLNYRSDYGGRGGGRGGASRGGVVVGYQRVGTRVPSATSAAAK
jgi:hypothetical protein